MDEINAKYNQVVLVDSQDRQIGTMDKVKAHQHPVPLHRAISIVIVNGRGEMLLQKRSQQKPTWPLYWSNACCTHPFDGEPGRVCAKRRLQEEMGFTTPLKYLFKYQYDARFDKTWGECELDSVYWGKYTGQVKPNPAEAEDYKWLPFAVLKSDIANNPSIYTPWFRDILRLLEKRKAV